MKISIVVAVSENGVIGKDNSLPWKMPADMARFREITTGHYIVMGRKTYESIGKPLPRRTNIIVSSSLQAGADGNIVVVDSLDNAIAYALWFDQGELMVIGGGEIYREALQIANQIYLTRIHVTVEGDTYFPEIDSNEWEEVFAEYHPADELNPYAYEFITKVRKVRG